MVLQSLQHLASIRLPGSTSCERAGGTVTGYCRVHGDKDDHLKDQNMPYLEKRFGKLKAMKRFWCDGGSRLPQPVTGHRI